MVNLGDPIEIAELQVKNRFVMPPMVTNFCKKNGEITDRLLNYYEQRSKGGTGLIIVEAAAIAWEHRIMDNNIGIHDDRFIPGLKTLAKCIKRHGAQAFIQINHAGSKSLIAERLVGPSAIRVLDRALPEELSIDEIEIIKELFVEAARRAQEAGFDGIELHGAHFYLLSAFISPYTNHRMDEYGGNLPNRVKLTVDIIKAIQRELGSFPLICRFNSIENIIHGIEIEEGKELAHRLEQAGVDALHVSGVATPYHNPEELAKFTLKTKPAFLKGYPDGSWIPCAAEIKKVVYLPVIGVGGVRNAAFAEQIMEEELCDLLAIGKGLIADPKFAEKMLSDTGEKLNHCEDCGLCLKRIWELKSIECSVNPDL